MWTEKKPRSLKNLKSNSSTAGDESVMSFVLRLFANGEIRQVVFDNEKNTVLWLSKYYDVVITDNPLSVTVITCLVWSEQMRAVEYPLPSLLPSAAGWLQLHSDLVDDVCVGLSLLGKGGRGLGKMSFPHRFFLLICICSPHKVETTPLVPRYPFATALLWHLLSRQRVHLLVWSLVLPVPLYKVSGTCWETVSHNKHKSYCLSTCTSTPQPGRVSSTF